MKVSIVHQILHHVENAPVKIEEVYENGLNWCSIRIIGCEFQATVPSTHLNLSWGLKSLKESFAKKLVDDFKAGKLLPFETETD